MKLPSSLISSTIEENKIYYFTARSPIGIRDHMHICIRKHDKLLLFSTCTSQMDTVYKLAMLQKQDMSTFPCFKKTLPIFLNQTTHLSTVITSFPVPKKISSVTCKTRSSFRLTV